MATPNGDSGSKTGGGSWMWPATTTAISGYNYTGSHHGIDIGVPSGGKVLSPTYGKVTKVGWDAKGYGLYVVIKTKLEGYSVYLAHLSKAKVNVGDSVNPGTVIGLGGSTGNSTGPHLHYEIRTAGGGGWINPWSIYGKNPKPGTVYNWGSGSTSPPGTTSTSGAPGSTSPASWSWDSLLPSIVLEPFASLAEYLQTVDWMNVATFTLGVVLVLIAVALFVSQEGSSIAGKVTGEAIGAALTAGA